MDNVNPNIPMRITGYLPMWSAARLHWSTVIASVTKNRDSWLREVNQRIQINWLTPLNNQPSIISDFALVTSCDIEFANKLSDSKSHDTNEWAKMPPDPLTTQLTHLIYVRIDWLARERLADLPEQDYCNLKFRKGSGRAFLRVSI